MILSASGHDKYPKDMNKAYNMLVNYVSPSRLLSNSDDQDGGMSFYQDNAQRGGPGCGGRRGRDANRQGRGRGCGGGTAGGTSNGGTSNDVSDNKNQHANVEEEEQQEIGSSNNSNNANSHAYSDASFNTFAADKLVLLHRLPLLWLLIDSFSTTNIFANAHLLTDIHIATTPIWVRCNACRTYSADPAGILWQLPISRVVQSKGSCQYSFT
jgi:hypothetical protein